MLWVEWFLNDIWSNYPVPFLLMVVFKPYINYFFIIKSFQIECIEFRIRQIKEIYQLNQSNTICFVAEWCNELAIDFYNYYLTNATVMNCDLICIDGKVSFSDTLLLHITLHTVIVKVCTRMVKLIYQIRTKASE